MAIRSGLSGGSVAGVVDWFVRRGLVNLMGVAAMAVLTAATANNLLGALWASWWRHGDAR